MGQPITPDLRAMLEAHRKVLYVTDEHVVLKDGRVVDPREFERAEFPGERCLVVKVYKLLRCTCGRHEAGLHVLIPAVERWSATGSLLDSTNQIALACPGEWTCEEFVSADHPDFKRLCALARRTLPTRENQSIIRP